ncbi:hypothetical protein EYF80_065953 [Liparis tanakae]|uniref:Uncharacterized protein n=1 Tax=Liparis tanakae TaxID=230148 RepID=A0A4Z2E5N9_9TELE|nr:hypothetical protein EYF80_065953 [Liparis tanakae]
MKQEVSAAPRPRLRLLGVSRPKESPEQQQVSGCGRGMRRTLCGSSSSAALLKRALHTPGWPSHATQNHITHDATWGSLPQSLQLLVGLDTFKQIKLSDGEEMLVLLSSRSLSILSVRRRRRVVLTDGARFSSIRPSCDLSLRLMDGARRSDPLPSSPGGGCCCPSHLQPLIHRKAAGRQRDAVTTAMQAFHYPGLN